MSEVTKIAPLDFAYSHFAEAKGTTPEPGVIRTVGAFNPKFLISHNQMVKNWVGTAHSHPHDQAAYVVSGHIRLVCDGQTVDLKAGDSYVVRGGVEHQATALEDSVIVDIFTPCREEFVG